jgi:hypothetical protein
MKPMVRRLRALERATLPAADAVEDQRVVQIRARRMRRLQLSGECDPADARSPLFPVAARGARLTIAEVLRYGRYGEQIHGGPR